MTALCFSNLWAVIVWQASTLHMLAHGASNSPVGVFAALQRSLEAEEARQPAKAADTTRRGATRVRWSSCLAAFACISA